MVTPHHISITKWSVSLKKSWVRRRRQILERILHNTNPMVFPLLSGLAVLLLGGADRAKLLKRIERRLSPIKPGGCF